MISYDEAEVILKAIGGTASPSEWQGGLEAAYNLGPNLIDNFTIKMEVYTTNQMATTYNTIGILRGEIEPGFCLIFRFKLVIKSFKRFTNRSLRAGGESSRRLDSGCYRSFEWYSRYDGDGQGFWQNEERSWQVYINPK